MTEDIFNTADRSNTVDDVLNVFADKLMQIKKEDGSPKYDTIEKALDALAASQEHINTLETEAKSRQQELENARKGGERNKELEELILRMNNNGIDQPGKIDDGDHIKVGLSKEDAAALVKQILNDEKQLTTAGQNINRVQEKLLARYGDKASDMIDAKAKELNVSKQQLKELSASSPNMVLALFGENNTNANGNTTSYNLGSRPPAPEPLKRPEKSLISGLGATDKNRTELMAKIKAQVYAKHGVEN